MKVSSGPRDAGLLTSHIESTAMFKTTFASGTLAKRLAIRTLAVAACLVPITASAQGIPQPDGPAVDVTVNTPAASRNPNAPQALILQDPGYNSVMLDAEFNAQWMKLASRGRTINFWGARIMELSPSSPLLNLGLKKNDVITRLDGVPIATGMTRTPPNKMWDVHELEKHFGPTKVRFIKNRTSVVQEKTVDLGPHRTQPLPPALDP